MIKIKPSVSCCDNKFKFFPTTWPLIDELEYKPKIFDWDGLEFYYDSDTIHGFIVPEDKNLDIDALLRETEISVSDWNLERVSTTPDPRYILNHYTRGDTTYSVLESSKSDLVEGDWKLENNELGVLIDFSVMAKKSSYTDSERRLLVCYPEKTEIPYDPVKIINKSNFILYILWKKLSLGKSSEK